MLIVSWCWCVIFHVFQLNEVLEEFLREVEQLSRWKRAEGERGRLRFPLPVEEAQRRWEIRTAFDIRTVTHPQRWFSRASCFWCSRRLWVQRRVKVSFWSFLIWADDYTSVSIHYSNVLFTRLLLSSIIFVIEIKEIKANSVILTCSGSETDKWYKNKDTNLLSTNDIYEVTASNGIVEGEYACEYTAESKTVKHLFYLNVKGEETSSWKHWWLWHCFSS